MRKAKLRSAIFANSAVKPNAVASVLALLIKKQKRISTARFTAEPAKRAKPKYSLT